MKYIIGLSASLVAIRTVHDTEAISPQCILLVLYKAPALDLHHVVNTGDLQAVTPGNLLIKFADDSLLT